ncbi:hypothetical protein GCM10008941_29680 [Rhizomicrobium palustre]
MLISACRPIAFLVGAIRQLRRVRSGNTGNQIPVVDIFTDLAVRLRAKVFDMTAPHIDTPPGIGAKAPLFSHKRVSDRETMCGGQ